MLGQAVLEAADGVFPAPPGPDFDHLVAGGVAFRIGFEEAVLLLVLVPQLAGGGIESDEDVLAELVAGLVDGLRDYLQGLVVALEAGGEAALVADARVVALRV